MLIIYIIGMISLIYIHELGHLLSMKYYKVPFSPMIFVPFIGAGISMKELPKSVYEESIIALSGPLLGTVGAVACTAIGNLGTSHMIEMNFVTNQLFYALADWGYVINLFNLLPLGSLDGGRITSAINPFFNILGIAGGGYLIYEGIIHNPLFYLILLSGTYTTGSRLYHHYRYGIIDPDKPFNYYHIPNSSKKYKITFYYFALIATLIGCMSYNNIYKVSSDKLLKQKQLQNHNQIQNQNNNNELETFFIEYSYKDDDDDDDDNKN